MDRNKITKELKRISHDNGGILHPELVVRLAKNKNSILHDCFEWNDAKAGREYRLWQARQLIRVSVEYSDITKQEYDVFVSLSTDRAKGDGYREVENVLGDEALRKILLADALREMELFVEKYKHLKELSAVFKSMKLIKSKYDLKAKNHNGYMINPLVTAVDA
jgi:hypothetical protein